MGRGAKGRGGGGRGRSHASHAHKSHVGHKHKPMSSASRSRSSAASRRNHQRSAFAFKSHRRTHHSRPLSPAERLALRINRQEEIPTGIGSLYLNGSGRVCCGDKAHTVAERQVPAKFHDLISQAEWDAFITAIDRAFDEEECPSLLAVLCCLPTLMLSCCIAEQKAANLLNKLTLILTAENHRLQAMGLQWVRTPGRAPAMCVLRWLPGVREQWEAANPHRRPVSREPPAREFLPNALQLQMGLNELAGRPAFAVLTPPQPPPMQLMFGQQPQPQQQQMMMMQPMQPQWSPPQQQGGMGAGPPQQSMGGMEMQPMQPQYGQMQMGMQMQQQQPPQQQQADPQFAYMHPMPLFDAAAAAEGGTDLPEGLPLQPMQPMYGQPMMQVQPAVVQPIWSPPVYSAHPHGFGQAPLPVYAPSQGPALYCTGCGAPKTLRIDDGPNPSNECESCGQVNK